MMSVAHCHSSHQYPSIYSKSTQQSIIRINSTIFVVEDFVNEVHDIELSWWNQCWNLFSFLYLISITSVYTYLPTLEFWGMLQGTLQWPSLNPHFLSYPTICPLSHHAQFSSDIEYSLVSKVKLNWVSTQSPRSWIVKIITKDTAVTVPVRAKS